MLTGRKALRIDLSMVSKVAHRHMKAPSGFGELEDADAVGYVGRRDRVGPFFHVYVKVDGEILREMRFVTYRCPWAIASGSVLTELARGKDLESVGRISEADLQQVLGEVPSNKLESLGMAIKAVRNGILMVRGRIKS